MRQLARQGLTALQLARAAPAPRAAVRSFGGSPLRAASQGPLAREEGGAEGVLVALFEAMNRNGRMAKKANHGARPCSSRGRKWKRQQRKIGKMRKR